MTAKELFKTTRLKQYVNTVAALDCLSWGNTGVAAIYSAPAVIHWLYKFNKKTDNNVCII